MKSVFGQMGGTYHWEGDYLIPDLTLGKDANRDIGTYGRRRMRFLEESHPALYANMLLSGQLWRRLEEINTACYERLEIMIPARQEGVTEVVETCRNPPIIVEYLFMGIGGLAEVDFQRLPFHNQ